MNVRERILLCRFLEKMEQHKEYSSRLGVENVSKFRGKRGIGKMK